MILLEEVIFLGFFRGFLEVFSLVLVWNIRFKYLGFKKFIFFYFLLVGDFGGSI